MAEQLRLESPDEVTVVRSNKKKEWFKNGKNEAIVSNEQTAQTKRKIDDAAVGNKSAGSKRQTSRKSNFNIRREEI